MKSYRTGPGTNDDASVSVRAMCLGEDAGAAAAVLVNALREENRRRRNAGERPIAFNVRAVKPEGGRTA